MEYPIIELNTRTKTGKMANLSLRKAGEVPVVLYAKNGDNFMGSLPIVAAQKLVANYSFLTQVFTVKLDGKNHLCIPRDVQFNPVTDKPDHFDFKIVALNDKIIVSVPTVVIGKENSVGLKRGGNVFMTSYNVKLRAIVGSIPSTVEIDVSDSVIGSKYYLRDLKIPNATPVYDCLVVKVSGRQTKEEAAAPGAAPAVATPAPVKKAAA
jgi:large subunit ribosomal protein L25